MSLSPLWVLSLSRCVTFHINLSFRGATPTPYGCTCRMQRCQAVQVSAKRQAWIHMACLAWLLASPAVNMDLTKGVNMDLTLVSGSWPPRPPSPHATLVVVPGMRMNTPAVPRNVLRNVKQMVRQARARPAPHSRASPYKPI